jgi:beta-lactamase regulating signal transducer with metallopeptidase domain
VIGWAFETLAASSLLMLVVLILRGPVAARFGAHAAYVLWSLPALRMILPRIPDITVPVAAVPIHFEIAKLVAVAASQPASAAPPIAAAASPSIDWFTAGLVVWLVGAAVYLAWQLGLHYRFMRIAIEQAGDGFLRGNVRVTLSPVVTGPLAAGIFHRRILLPEDFARRYTGAEQQLALAHELAHHRRGDLIANGAALAMLALHWFNPIAHWAYRAFRADQELACDATVLADAPGARSDYGRALIKSARAGMSTAACALGPATQLKRRMTMITQSSCSRARRIAGTSLAGILVGAGLCLTASGSIAAPSKIAPTAVKPLFAPQENIQPEAKPIEAAEQRTPTAPATTDGADDDTAARMAQPLPPVAPIPPVPPVASAAPMSAAQIQQIRRAGNEAGEAARLAVANIDFGRIIRDAMAEARAELARECAHAKPAPANESDQAAFARLSAGCVDMAAINREVQDALRQAGDEIRTSKGMAEADRVRAIAAVEQARAEIARRNDAH